MVQITIAGAFYGCQPANSSHSPGEGLCSSIQTAGLHIGDRGSDKGSGRIVTSRIQFFIFALGMTTHPNTNIAINQGAQRILLKGDKVLCLWRLWVLLLSQWGGGGRGGFFFRRFFFFPQPPPPPHACRRTSLVWSMMAFDPTPGKTSGHEKSHSLPLPFLAFFMGYTSAAAQDLVPPGNSHGYWLPCTATQLSISCHEMARTALRKSIRHPPNFAGLPLRANWQRDLFALPSRSGMCTARQ
jgi:hypothetical protein